MTTFRIFKILLATLVLAPSSLVVDGLPTTLAQTAQPNIVIIMTDDQDVDSLPVMRNLMSYPEGSWIKFNMAYANDSICCPARATMLTGQYAHHTGVLDNRTGKELDDTNTLPVWLDNAGYQTALIGKYLNGYPWDRGRNYVPPGWDHFEVKRINVDRRAELAVDFINTATSPFFLYLAFSEPHHPTRPRERHREAPVYVPPDSPNFNEADVSDKPTWVRRLRKPTTSVINRLREERIVSQRTLLGVDDAVQRIVDTLKANGELDHTMIIFLGDNGYSWGSHQFIGKPCVYEECSNIPLLIRYPGFPGNREEDRIVSNVDLALTIAEYAGITPGLPQDGKSLMPLLNNTATDWREEILLEAHGYRRISFFGIRIPGWVYAEYANGDTELYDLTTDPYQLQNQVNNPEFAAMRDELVDRLYRLTDGLPPFATAESDRIEELDPEEIAWWLEGESGAEPEESSAYELYIPQLGQ